MTLVVTAPSASSGRSFKLNYRIQSSLTISGKTHNSDWETIIQDDKDQLRQQYVDMDTGAVAAPSRSSSALKNSGTYVNPGNLTFSGCQCNGGGYCGSHAYLLDDTVSTRFQAVRNQHGSAIYETSVYRCPRWNKHETGKKTSKHIQGDAFDYQQHTPNRTTKNWNVAQSADDANVSDTKILLYPQAGGGDPMSLYTLELGGYSDTNLPPGWTEFRFGHVTTD